MQTGTHFQMGNWACAEGALAAGCNFVAGYPITPASEIANFMALRLPQVGGTFLQTEDEISACCAAIGASWSGCRAMTVTSGPGISLMQESIGFAVATETPQATETSLIDTIDPNPFRFHLNLFVSCPSFLPPSRSFDYL